MIVFHRQKKKPDSVKNFVSGVLLITLQKKKPGSVKTLRVVYYWSHYKRKKWWGITTKEKKWMKIFEKIGFFIFRIAKYFEKI